MVDRRLWKQLLTKKSVGAAHCQRTMFDFCEFITMLEPKVKKEVLRKLSFCLGVFW